MRRLSVSDIILLHRKLIDQTGGSHGIRDSGLVESALNKAQASFDGKDLYHTLQLGLGIASGSVSEAEIISWIQEHQKA
jgi:prophage maintenance system killer protein